MRAEHFVAGVRFLETDVQGSPDQGEPWSASDEVLLPELLRFERLRLQCAQVRHATSAL